MRIQGGDTMQKEIIVAIIIVVCYAIYACTNWPNPDGAVFGTVLAALGGILGFTVGSRYEASKWAEVGDVEPDP